MKFSGGEVKKRVHSLPPHSKLRIQANFHFIDAWRGEIGFMRMNTGKEGAMEIVWTEKYDF